MNTGLIARASLTIAAPAADVWEALVTPAVIKTYMFGVTVTSETRVEEISEYGQVLMWHRDKQKIGQRIGQIGALAFRGRPRFIQF